MTNSSIPMKTDRELLELAARAAGIEIVDWSCIEESCDAIARLEYRHLHKWNPLTDDGDALRLETALGLDVYWHENYVYIERGKKWLSVMFSDHDYDKNKARRYASVTIAAAIGETL